MTVDLFGADEADYHAEIWRWRRLGWILVFSIYRNPAGAEGFTIRAWWIDPQTHQAEPGDTMPIATLKTAGPILSSRGFHNAGRCDKDPPDLVETWVQ